MMGNTEEAAECVSEAPSNVMLRNGRMLSVDLFRGVVMFLLIGKVTGFYDLFSGIGYRGDVCSTPSASNSSTIPGTA